MHRAARNIDAVYMQFYTIIFVECGQEVGRWKEERDAFFFGSLFSFQMNINIVFIDIRVI